MLDKDIKECMNKYNTFYKKYKIYQVFSEKEFRHKFLSANNVCESFVIEQNGCITDFISVFYVNTRILNNNKYSDYSMAQIYHYFYSNIQNLIDMVDDIICLMNKKNIDMVNCINQMDSYIFLDKLKFKEKNSINNFYLWNMKCLPVTQQDISLITI